MKSTNNTYICNMKYQVSDYEATQYNRTKAGIF